MHRLQCLQSSNESFQFFSEQKGDALVPGGDAALRDDGGGRSEVGSPRVLRDGVER